MTENMSNIIYNFSEKVVLITGSSSGIGASTAILFAKSGAQVVITSNVEQQLSEVTEKCHKISPNNLKPLQVLADVTKEEDLKRLVESIIKEFGRIDILVNNVGLCVLKGITEPDYMDVFKNTFQTNFNSMVYLTHLCVEYLAKTKGNIVNIASIAADFTGNGLSAYSMSKSAVNMFTKCMSAELGEKGIRVNSISPGCIRTGISERSGMSEEQADQLYDRLTKSNPVRRYGVPEDIANDILFLASEESSFKTATNVVSDGGQTAANIPLI